MEDHIELILQLLNENSINNSLTIEISPQDRAFLGRWASLGRAFDAIKEALQDPENEQAFLDAMDTIEDIEGPLKRMHETLRAAIWSNQCGKLVRNLRGFANDHICRLPKGHSGDCKG